jgi:GR25 family glycosyltransferase involved in LPS biosynthesis
MLKYILITVIIVIIILLSRQNIDLFNVDKNKNGLNRCDGIVYINLENRDDRKELFLKEIRKINLDESKLHKVSGIYIPNNGHKGCIQSHILALRIAKMNKWNMTCIMEDDVELITNADDFNNKVNAIFNELESKNIDWDVLSLMVFNKSIVNNKQYDTIDRISNGTTSACYIIKGHYIDKLISLFEYCQTMMSYNKWGNDNYHEPYALDQKWNELMKIDNWFSSKDNLIRQRNIRSTINSRK